MTTDEFELQLRIKNRTVKSDCIPVHKGRRRARTQKQKDMSS